MIYTVTCNPSLDYGVTVEGFEMHKTNRTTTESMVVGGKGINVSIVMKNLGIASTALGFQGGFVGEEIGRQIDKMGIVAELIPVEQGNSRINVKLVNHEGTEINGIGPAVSEEERQKLMEKLERLQKGDVVVLAGSIPATLPVDFYGQIAKRMEKKGVDVVVDATGEVLRNVLPWHPFLIKPNRDELEDFFGVSIHTKEEVLVYAKELQGLGAKNVLVSMAGDGALLLAEDGSVYKSGPLKGVLVNGVGAGDSMVAGFLAGWMSSDKSYEKAFQMAVAAGSASAFSEGLATREKVEELLRMSMAE